MVWAGHPRRRPCCHRQTSQRCSSYRSPPCGAGGGGIVLLKKRGHDRSRTLILGAFQEEVFPPEELAPSNDENLDTALVPLLRKSYGILVFSLGRDDFLPLDDLFHC